MKQQNHEIRVKLNAEEHEIIKKKSEKLKMTMTGYLKFLGINSTIEVVLRE